MASQRLSETSAEPGENASTTRIIREVGRVEEELVRVIGNHCTAMQVEMSKLRAEFTEKFAEFHALASSFTTRPPSSFSDPSAPKAKTSTKRDLPDPDNVPHLSQLLVKDKYRAPTIKHLIMLTVMCFASEYKQLDFWVPQPMKPPMTGIESKLLDVSGFGLHFFSTSKEDKIQMYTGNIGKLWSWMICSSIAAVIAQSVHVDFESKGLTAPSWMRSFGDLDHATGLVEPIVDCLEKHYIVPLVKGTSKRHKNADAEVTSVLDTDPLRGTRELVTDCLRSGILAELTDGRLRSRSRLYKKFTFVLERMKAFYSLTEAHVAGFDIYFDPPATAEELSIPAVVGPGDLWDIPKTTVGSPSDPSINANNVNLFKTCLLGKFKFMNGMIKVAKEVFRTEEDKRDAFTHPEVNQPSLLCKFSEEINLHVVASTMLVDEFGLKHLAALLSYNALSLRVIHITALALRGLIATGTGSELEPVEKCALGDVIFEPLEKGECDNLATVALGKRSDGQRKRKDSAKLIQMRESKRYMTWAEYKKEKKERAIRARAQHETGTSDAGTTSSGNYGGAGPPQPTATSKNLSWMDGN